jgi:AraC-like DNA-binding protein
MITFFLYFNGFTIFNLVVLFVILFFRKENSLANKLLALIVINPGLNFINNIFILSDWIFQFPFVYFFFQGTAVFYAPLVLAYTNVLTGRRFKFLSLLNLLSLGLILLDLFYCLQFYQLPQNLQVDYLQGLTNGNYPEQMMIYSNLFVLVMLAYLVVALLQIRKYAQVANDFFSDTERVKLKYLLHFVWLLAILNIMLTIAYATFQTPVVEYFFIPVIINTIYVYIVFYAFSQSAILSKVEFCNLMEDVDQLERFKQYQEPLCKESRALHVELARSSGKFKLAELEMEENYRKILQLFEERKIYLDPAINLTRLSHEINACSHNISMTINTRFNKNFFELINSYRIEEAKILLSSESSKRMTIEAIGIHAGFNTKSAFYRAFKKHTGQTPSEFLQLSKN